MKPQTNCLITNCTYREYIYELNSEFDIIIYFIKALLYIFVSVIHI